jgi:putative sigma-54 modulation protein
MNVEYTGRQTVVAAKHKTQAESGLARVEKVANRCTSAHVILTEDKYRRIAEITVSCRGEQLVAMCEGTDMEAALHDALQKVEQQAIKHKKRWDTMRDHPKPIAVVEAA